MDIDSLHSIKNLWYSSLNVAIIFSLGFTYLCFLSTFLSVSLWKFPGADYDAAGSKSGFKNLKGVVS